MIADHAIPKDLYEKTVAISSRTDEMMKGAVGNTDPSDTDYNFTEDHQFDYLGKWLQDSGLIPILPDHDVKMASRHHRMHKAGKMAWHCDGDYSIAATLYLSQCEGGELQVLAPCETKSIFVKPMPNRLVVLKCENRHRVVEVIEGQRDSIQIFFTYVRRGA